MKETFNFFQVQRDLNDHTIKSRKKWCALYVILNFNF